MDAIFANMQDIVSSSILANMNYEIIPCVINTVTAPNASSYSTSIQTTKSIKIIAAMLAVKLRNANTTVSNEYRGPLCLPFTYNTNISDGQGHELIIQYSPNTNQIAITVNQSSNQAILISGYFFVF